MEADAQNAGEPAIIESTRADGFVHKARIDVGLSFGRAVADHFGLPREQVMAGMKVHSGEDEIFSITMTVALTPADLAGIGAHMAAGGVNQPGQDQPTPPIACMKCEKNYGGHHPDCPERAAASSFRPVNPGAPSAG